MSAARLPPLARPGHLVHSLNPRAGQKLRCTWSDQPWWTVGTIYPVGPGPALCDDDGDIRPIGRDTFRGRCVPQFERVHP